MDISQQPASACLSLFCFYFLPRRIYFAPRRSRFKVVRGRPEARVFQRTFPVCGAQRAGIRKLEENGGQRGRAGKRGEMKRLESLKVN